MSPSSPLARQRRAASSVLSYATAGSLGASLNALAGYAFDLQPPGCVTRGGLVGSFLATAFIATVLWAVPSKRIEP